MNSWAKRAYGMLFYCTNFLACICALCSAIFWFVLFKLSRNIGLPAFLRIENNWVGCNACNQTLYSEMLCIYLLVAKSILPSKVWCQLRKVGFLLKSHQEYKISTALDSGATWKKIFSSQLWTYWCSIFHILESHWSFSKKIAILT